MWIKHSRAGGCVPETYQTAPTVIVVPTMTSYATCHVPYTPPVGGHCKKTAEHQIIMTKK